MKNKKFWQGAAAGGAVTALLLLFGIRITVGDGVLADPGVIKKLSYLEQVIDRNYLEEPEKEELEEGLYAGLLYGLGDPYSYYYTEEEYEEESSATEGAYVGVGVALQKNPEGGVRVVECYEGGPAEKAGVKAEDIISAVDGVDVTEMETSEVVDLVQESSKEAVTLTVHRQDVEEPLSFSVEITDVELPTVFPEMLDENTGYIRISSFSGVTCEQYQEAFAQLSEAGMEQLIIDLRGNPGGLLTSVCDILREILPEGLIVYTEDKYGNREEYTCDGEHPLKMPLAVLVNEASASASEIFAGAVQDYSIGTIVGTNTYGKGVVQAILPLEDKSAVKLTVSRYYTPKGNSIHEKGIAPDVEVRLDSELLNKEEISHEEDNQLQAARKVLGS